MFKFFRKYNKIILAVGGSILMVLFLLPNLSGMFQPDPADESAGTVGGRELTVADTRRAHGELGILRQLGLVDVVTDRQGQPFLVMAAVIPSPYRQYTVPISSKSSAELQWLLMIEEARRHGLYGSRVVAEQIKSSIPEDRFSSVRKGANATDDIILNVLRRLVMVEQLNNLAMSPRRVSDPMVRHMVRDTMSSVTIEILELPAEMLLDEIDEPTEEELNKRFAINKADVPGNSKPYGFGYRIPNRVKLEYLRFPLERIKESIQITDVDANAYYLDHPDQFLPQPEEESTDEETTGEEATETTPKPDPTKPLPYADVRDKAFDLTKTARAQALRDRMLKFASGLLREQEMRWPRDDTSGYYNIPDGLIPLELETVAKAVQEEYGVLPDVVRIDEKWLKVPDDLLSLTDIGDAYLATGSGAARQTYPLAAMRTAQGVFPGYIDSLRELKPPANHPLIPLRLQAKVVSRPMVDGSGDGYLVRASAAEASRVPTSLNEVREDVVRDVKRLKAYGKIAKSMNGWLEAAQRDGMEKLATNRGERYDTELAPRTVGPFPRRQIDQRTGRIRVPFLPGIGQSEQFVDLLFNQVAAMEEQGKSITDDEASYFGIGLEQNLTHYIVHVTDYRLPTRQEFEQMKFFAGIIARQMDAAQSGANVHPFSFQALSQRVDYTAPVYEKPEEEKDKDKEPADPEEQ